MVLGCARESDWDLVSKADFPSPDGQRVATVFEMCCYCTTGYFPQLTVRRATEEFAGQYGNVLQGGPGDTVKVRWTSPTNLVIEHHSMGKLVAHSVGTTNVAGVLVEFVNP